MKRLLIVLIAIITVLPATASPFEYRTTKSGFNYIYHKHNESSYQHAYCSMHNGIEEYELSDKTRVDCLTDKYAIEFDFANKKYEAVGQALHYGIMTGKTPKVVLILDKKFEKKQLCYYERIKNIGEVYGFEVEYITDDILNLDKDGRCPYTDCKCNRKLSKKSKRASDSKDNQQDRTK